MLKKLIYLNLLVALLGVTVVYYSHFLIKPQATDQNQETINLKASITTQAEVRPVPIKKFVVNLRSPANKLRFISMEMNILPFFENQKNLITDNEYLIKDIVIELASHLTVEEVETVTGKMLFESRIKKQVNAKLGQPVIKQIFFSGFVIQ